MKNITSFFNKFLKTYNELCEVNPFILDYSYEEKRFEENIQLLVDNEQNNTNTEEKYETKYLEKFKKFPNEYLPFTQEECELQNKILEEMKRNEIELNMKIINELRVEQQKLKNIIDNIETAGGPLTENGLKILIEYEPDIEQLDLNDEDEEQEIIFLYDEIKSNLQENTEELNELEKNIFNSEKGDEIYILSEERETYLKEQSYQTIINNRIKNLMNSVLLEMTPLGNVYMRYNFEKGSFEYFSNHSIPYRYLEPIGRRYVMTFWCKPLFIDLEEELKRVEIKLEEEKKKEQERLEQEKQKGIQQTISGINTQKSVFAKLKSYNNVSTNSTSNKPSLVPKNRNASQLPLPPQIKANLPDVNGSNSDKQLLKENANRYTWEGRFQDFCPIKKIDRKVVDKKLNMSWAEFKKMQQKV